MPHAPHWSIGMEKLDAGIWFDGRDCIHVDQGEFSTPREMRRTAITRLLVWLESQRMQQQCIDFEEKANATS